MHILWDRLNGYWISGTDLFIGFFDGSDIYDFEYGLQRSSYWTKGTVTNIEATGENTIKVTIRIAATPTTQMDAARPERTEIFYLDISDLEPKGTIKVKLDNLDSGE